jgi:hypothetical protein
VKFAKTRSSIRVSTARKTCGGVYNIPLEFRIIMAFRQKCPALPVKTRSTEVP